MTKLLNALEFLELTADAAKALVEYLNLGDYLNDYQINQAVDYLAEVKPFQFNSEIIDKSIVKQDLKQSCALARSVANFDPEIFIKNFASQEYFTLNDIIDLLTFLQQTAYARHFGAERDTLQTQSWMERHSAKFIELAARLGVIATIEPPQVHYCGIGIMGTISTNCRRNLEFFARQQQLSYDAAWVLTGQRELSFGLDSKEDIEAVANYFKKPLQFRRGTIGNFPREFAQNITESMLLEYLGSQICPHSHLKIIASEVQPGHWRATAAQSAKDIAALVIRKILQQELKPDLQHDCYYFLVVAAQPAIQRMAMQVERGFALEMHKHKLPLNLKVHCCGPGIETVHLNQNTPSNILARIDSELAALAAERYYNARIGLQERGFRNLRSSKCLLYATRNVVYEM